MPSSRGCSQLRDRTCVSCNSRRILYHWATREALSGCLVNLHVTQSAQGRRTRTTLTRRQEPRTLEGRQPRCVSRLSVSWNAQNFPMLIFYTLPARSWNAYLGPVHHVLHRSSGRIVCCVHGHSRLQNKYVEIKNETSIKEASILNTVYTGKHWRPQSHNLKYMRLRAGKDSLTTNINTSYKNMHNHTHTHTHTHTQEIQQHYNCGAYQLRLLVISIFFCMFFWISKVFYDNHTLLFHSSETRKINIP